MKKLFIISCLSCLIISCGNQDNDAAKNNSQAAEAPKKVEDPEVKKGLELIAKSDCLTCHKLNDQLVGPPYSAVAERYAKTDLVIDTLSDKIIKGGTGRWGTVPMTAHPQISKEDAKTMVKYVLSITK